MLFAIQLQDIHQFITAKKKKESFARYDNEINETMRYLVQEEYHMNT
jgi:hypothetical protein